MNLRLRPVSLLSLLFPSFLFCQMVEPPVPSDPLELVTSNTEAVQTVSQRAATVKLLANAFALSNVRDYAYDRKTVFTSFGSTLSDGSWQLEDASPWAGVYRWTAQGPGYSVINLFKNQELFSNQAAGSMPLRLAQVRAGMFFVRPMVGPRATLRIAAGSLNGVTLQCVLLSHMAAAKNATGGRRWEEAEYCIDPNTGTMVTYSPAPGIYMLYDYSEAVHFHEKLIPNKFTVTQAGQTIIEAKTVSVSDAPTEPAMYETAGLQATGVGSLMTAPSTIHNFGAAQNGGSGTSQLVVVCGMKSGIGPLTDLAVAASSNSTMNSQALQMAASLASEGNQDDYEPGATTQSHEVIAVIQVGR